MWDEAGAFVVHPHDVDPTVLGQALRAAGFGWVAIGLGQAGTPEPLDADWISRFRQASGGLAVGGWSVLDDDPAADAAFAAQAIQQDGLSFYIADAEESYQEVSPQRSEAFVAAFRAAEPNLTAGLSSLCDAQGIGLAPWALAGFAFLPQAYVNDFGQAVIPAACVRAAAPFFSLSQVHPTVASYRGRHRVKPGKFVHLLAQARTFGFSVYPADEATAATWQAYGQAIASKHIAEPAP